MQQTKTNKSRAPQWTLTADEYDDITSTHAANMESGLSERDSIKTIREFYMDEYGFSESQVKNKIPNILKGKITRPAVPSAGIEKMSNTNRSTPKTLKRKKTAESEEGEEGKEVKNEKEMGCIISGSDQYNLRTVICRGTNLASLIYVFIPIWDRIIIPTIVDQPEKLTIVYTFPPKDGKKIYQIMKEKLKDIAIPQGYKKIVEAALLKSDLDETLTNEIVVEFPFKINPKETKNLQLANMIICIVTEAHENLNETKNKKVEEELFI